MMRARAYLQANTALVRMFFDSRQEQMDIKEHLRRAAENLERAREILDNRD